VNLEASDAELVATLSATASSDTKETGGKEGNPADSALTLKRARDLEVGDANAEWRVGEGVIVIYA
jgi:hypothetical protein